MNQISKTTGFLLELDPMSLQFIQEITLFEFMDNMFTEWLMVSTSLSEFKNTIKSWIPDYETLCPEISLYGTTRII